MARKWIFVGAILAWAAVAPASTPNVKIAGPELAPPVPVGIDAAPAPELNLAAPSPVPIPSGYAVPGGPFTEVYRKLLTLGADPLFITELARDPRLEPDLKLVRMNVLNFAQPSHYENFLNSNSVKNCRVFLRRHRVSFERCQRRFGVPKEVVAALLWVETKHGADMGHKHVTNVFLNLAMAERPEAQAFTLSWLREQMPEADPKFPALRLKAQTRAKTKSEWALQELLALGRDWKDFQLGFRHLEGSVSGAFGMSQFVPSSYLLWAQDGDGDGKVDLFHPADAICSVANYLRQNGWSTAKEGRRAALYHYNRSTDYGQTILQLARMIEQKGGGKKARKRPRRSANG